jgi:hypothetical protein
MKLATCIGCGCTDWRACVNDDGESCYWLRVDAAQGVGVCSMCPEYAERWDAGNRERSRRHEMDAAQTT